MRGREFKDAIYAQFARVGAAFSSPKRIEILDLLAQSGRSVDSIAAATGLSVANTSRHLQVLRSAGLVVSQRDGLRVIYRISDPEVVRGYQALRTLAESRIAEVDHLAHAFFGTVDGAEPVGLDELARRVDDDQIVIVDVRPALEFEASHIAGAVSIPFDQLATRMAELPGDASVVAYCRGPYCVLAAQAVAQLRTGGFTAARLAGGLPEWQAAGLPIGSGPPIPHSAA